MYARSAGSLAIVLHPICSVAAAGVGAAAGAPLPPGPDFSSHSLHSPDGGAQIYNLSHPGDVLAGGRPRVRLHGPYTYRETIERHSVTFSDDLETVSFDEFQQFEFEPAMSVRGWSPRDPRRAASCATAVPALDGPLAHASSPPAPVPGKSGSESDVFTTPNVVYAAAAKVCQQAGIYRCEQQPVGVPYRGADAPTP